MNAWQRRFCGRGVGFTLIELVTVLGLVALLAATVAVTWRPSPAARLQAAQLVLEQLVAQARERSAAVQEPVRLVVVRESPPNASAGPARWHLRLFRSTHPDPHTWRPDGSAVGLPEDVIFVASSAPMLPAAAAEFGASVRASQYGEFVWCVEFHPDGDFQPRNESGEGVMEVSVTEADGGSRRRAVHWRRNGGVTRGVEELIP